MAFKAVVSNRVELRAVVNSVSTSASNTVALQSILTSYVKPAVTVTYQNIQAASVYLDAYSLNRIFDDLLSFNEQTAFAVSKSLESSYSLIDQTGFGVAKPLSSDFSFSDLTSNEVSKGISSTVGFSSNAFVEALYNRVFNDSFDFNDVVSLGTSKERTSSFEFIDSLLIQLEFFRSFSSDEISFSDELDYDVDKGLSSSVGFADELNFAASKDLSSHYGLSDLAAVSTSKPASSDFSFVDSQLIQVTFTRSFDLDQIEFSDETVFVNTKALTSSYSFTDEHTYQVSKNLDSSYTFNDVLGYLIQKPFSSAYGLGDLQNILLQKPFDASVGMADSQELQVTWSRSFDLDNVSLLDDQQVSLNKLLTSDYSLSDEAKVLLGKNVSSDFSFSDALNYSAAKGLDSSYALESTVSNSVSKPEDSSISFLDETANYSAKGLTSSYGFQDTFESLITYNIYPSSVFTLDDFITAGIPDVLKSTQGDKTNIFSFNDETSFVTAKELSSVATLSSNHGIAFTPGVFTSSYSFLDNSVYSLAKPFSSDFYFSDSEVITLEKGLSSELDLQSLHSISFTPGIFTSDYTFGDEVALDQGKPIASDTSLSDDVSQSVGKPLSSSQSLSDTDNKLTEKPVDDRLFYADHYSIEELVDIFRYMMNMTVGTTAIENAGVPDEWVDRIGSVAGSVIEGVTYWDLIDIGDVGVMMNYVVDRRSEDENTYFFEYWDDDTWDLDSTHSTILADIIAGDDAQYLPNTIYFSDEAQLSTGLSTESSFDFSDTDARLTNKGVDSSFSFGSVLVNSSSKGLTSDYSFTSTQNKAVAKSFAAGEFTLDAFTPLELADVSIFIMTMVVGFDNPGVPDFWWNGFAGVAGAVVDGETVYTTLDTGDVGAIGTYINNKYGSDAYNDYYNAFTDTDGWTFTNGHTDVIPNLIAGGGQYLPNSIHFESESSFALSSSTDSSYSLVDVTSNGVSKNFSSDQIGFTDYTSVALFSDGDSNSSPNTSAFNASSFN